MAVADYTIDTVIDSDTLKSLIVGHVCGLTEKQLDEIFKAAIIDSSSKMSSKSNVLLNLKQTPKIIKRIKEISPYTFLVGFKLLNDTTEENLFNVGFDLLRKNRCNLVLANDLTKIKQGEHAGMLIYPEKTMDNFNGKQAISRNLVRIIKNRIGAAHPHSNRIGNWLPDVSDADVFNQIGSTLARMELLPHVINHENTDKSGTYGNMSMRAEPNGFIITGRNVDKTNIKTKELVKVENVCFEENENGICKTYSEVNYYSFEEAMKPSIDASIHAKIYDMFDVKAILHVHTPDKLFLDVPVVYGKYPCGSKPEMDAIIDVMCKNEVLSNIVKVIQIDKHGLMIFGDTLFECKSILDDLLENRPYIALSEKSTDEECTEHVIDFGADFVTEEASYQLKIKDTVIGMVWEVVDTSIKMVDFGIYVKSEFQRKGLGIIKKYLNMRQNNMMALHTTEACNIEDLYNTKYGFKTLWFDKETGHITLIKKDN